MAYRSISDYGVIGNMHSAALVSGDGWIDWLCFPRFDSPSVFAAVLDDENGGRFRIRPAGRFESHQSYLPETNILRTDFTTPAGHASLTDFMPVGEQLMDSEHAVIRIVRCEAGSVDMDARFDPRLDYARPATSLSGEGRVAVARKGADSLALCCSVPLRQTGDGAQARFRLSEGDWAAFVLRWKDESPRRVEESDVYGELGKTQAFWHFISRDWRYTGRWAEIVKRSMLALHLLIYVPTGAVCAAVTTSLPERIGGVRNWDYRFSWLRDAAFTMDVFHRLGHTTYTRPFIEWMSTLALCDEGRDIQTLFGIGREERPGDTEEYALEHLTGYKGSRPVRVGNAAYDQFQLDVYGEIMLAFDSYHRAGGILDDRLWGIAECLVEGALRNWQRPDNGIWEFRTDPKHFTYSKLMAWVAADRGLRLARALKRPVDYDRWKRERGLIREDLLAHGWDDGRRSFVQYYGTKALDASLLFIPMVGFLPPEDARVHATIDAVRAELGTDGMLRRYIPEEARDGLPGDEGTFIMCSLWLAGSLVAAGRVDEAREVFDSIIGYGNHLGLYSEMLEPSTGEYLGNYPQAFTHIALIHTAKNLDRALNRAETASVAA